MVFVTSFVASLLTGGLGIYVGARLVVGGEDPVHALLTGLIGAVIWLVGGAVFGWIPLLGQLLVLAVYTWMVNRRYPGGWTDALLIALVAWLVTLVVLSILAALGFVTYEVIGVPFT
jgi:hypothetical protein